MISVGLQAESCSGPVAYCRRMVKDALTESAEAAPLPALNRLLLIPLLLLSILLISGAVPSLISAAQNGITDVSSKRMAVKTETLAPALQITLTSEEKIYLERLGPITVCPDPDWIPYEYMDSNGSYTGIAADLMELMANSPRY